MFHKWFEWRVSRGAVLCAVLLATPAMNRAGAAEPLAEVDGFPIGAAAVENPLGAKLNELEEQIYNLKRERIDALIDERLLALEAKRRGLSAAALLDAEVTARVGLVTEQEIEDFYKANREQIGADLAGVREKIRAYLQSQKLRERRREYLATLRSRSKILVHLKPPAAYRADVQVEGAPFKGAPGAPVTLVEFTDFHCPFCRNALATLKRLQEKYGDRLKLVFRDFPLENLHPEARRAHEAARCAGDQGQFWPYHDQLFAAAPKAAPEDLKALAAEVGLDGAAFAVCLDSGKFKAAVQADIDEGQRIGVNGTPAFFINGRPVRGAQPFDHFVRIIDDELQRVR